MIQKTFQAVCSILDKQHGISTQAAHYNISVFLHTVNLLNHYIVICRSYCKQWRLGKHTL